MIQFLNNTVARHYKGKICLLRVDLNISFKDESDSFRLESIIPTIKLLLKHKIKVVILSHRGRPRESEKVFSLSPFAPIIAKRTGAPVDFIAAYRMGAFRKAVQRSTARLVLLENLRFFRGEEMNDPSFARELAKFGDFYVNDAFAVSHRANASVVAITKFLPSFGGLLLGKEVMHLNEGLTKQKHPFVVIIGGAKISDKLGVIKNFWNKVDVFLLGGGPANTIFKRQGLPVWNSLVDRSILGSPISEIFRKSDFHKLILPVDVKISGRKILDIGPMTAKEYEKIILSAKTIIWNGPMGVFEEKQFTKGTEAIWRAVLKNKKAKIIIGGGDTMISSKLISNFKFQISKKKNIFISTGGGAMLEYLSGKKLPGIEVLKHQNL